MPLDNLNPNPSKVEWESQEEIKLRQYCMDTALRLHSIPSYKGDNYQKTADDVYNWIKKSANGDPRDAGTGTS